MDFIKGNADVFEKILSYLSVKDILNCNLVCKAWYTQTNVNSIWKRFCEEEDIDPEEWDWDITDGDEWILDTPCKWKNYFLKKNKTVFNWKNNICKVEELKDFDYFIDTAYDGKTLVVDKCKHLNVFTISKTDIKFVQLLECNELYGYYFKTNTDFIVVLNTNFVAVYMLIDNYYKLDYSIKKKNEKLIMYKEEVVEREDLDKSCRINDMWILGDILYITYHCDSLIEIYFWSLKEKRQLLHLNNIKCYTYDNKFSYIINELKPLTTDDDSCYKITVYNKNMEVYYVINTNFCVNTLYINHHLLIGLQKVEPLPEMIAWDKHSGQEVIPCQKLNFDINDKIYFHPKLDIIITSNTETNIITGYKLHNIEKLWVLNRCVDSNGAFLFDYWIDGVMFILDESYWGPVGESSFYETVEVYNAYNANYLYCITIKMNLRGMAPIHVYNDLMIYNDYNKSLIIRLYRS